MAGLRPLHGRQGNRACPTRMEILDADCEVGLPEPDTIQTREGTMMTRDEFIRDARTRAGTLPAVFVVYGILLATMIATGMAIT